MLAVWPRVSQTSHLAAVRGTAGAVSASSTRPVFPFKGALSVRLRAHVCFGALADPVRREQPVHHPVARSHVAAKVGHGPEAGVGRSLVEAAFAARHLLGLAVAIDLVRE